MTKQQRPPAGRRLHRLARLREIVEGLPQFKGELGTDIAQVSPERRLERHRRTGPARMDAVNMAAIYGERTDGLRDRGTASRR